MDILSPVINKDKCNGCGDCVSNCPAGLLTMQGGYPIFRKDQGECLYCGNCEGSCKNKAIRCPYDIRVS